MRTDSIAGFIDNGSPVIGTVTDFSPGSMPDTHSHARGQIAWCPNRPVTVVTEGQMMLVSPGAAIWLPPQRLHRISARTARQSVNLYCLPGAAPLPDRVAHFALAPLERELMRTLAGASRSDRREASFGRLAAVFWDRLKRPASAPTLPLPSHPKLRRIAMASIEPGDEQSLDDWAGTLALSRRSLQRLVARETGQSWRGWTRALRLARAIAPLMDGQNIQAAAHAAGYATVSAFIAAFRDNYGVTPGSLQRQVSD